VHFPHLFQEGKIGTCVLKNRLIMSLYPTKYATDSRVNERMVEFYRERARGGVALIVLDCPCLDYPRAYKGPNELRFDTYEYAEGVKKLLKAIQNEGARAFMQLNYPKERVFDHEVPGSKQKGNVWISSLVNTMTSEEAKEIVDIIAEGAQKAGELGYDGIEVQASYGDLISQLLSPISNKRTDDYGGSLENRARFLLQLLKAVKNAGGEDFPVIVKLVCDEFVPNGLTLKDTAKVARYISEAGGDAILASGGNKTTKRMTTPSHYLPTGTLVHLAMAIKKAVDIPVIAVGKINSPELADKIIRENGADFVAMARALIADPYLPVKAQEGNVDDIRGCVYDLEDCAEKGVKGLGRACTVNPLSGREYRLKLTPAPKKKKVIVIGGGPAGIQSAILASQRGHEVILYEKDASIGGQMRLASMAPFKAEMDEVLRYLKHSLGKTRTKIVLKCAPAAEAILSQEPDVVVIATGSHPAFPAIPGIDNSFVYDVRTVYERILELGENVIILGGGDTGCETADLLSSESRRITVVEVLDEPLKKMKDIPRQELLKRLKDRGVTIFADCKAISIDKGQVTIEDRDGVKRRLIADSVVAATGSCPVNELFKSLRDSVEEIYLVGDAKQPGNLGAALRSAAEISLKI
jgi:2,4-dienoyl-CoA reductase-like NADH-dependent reductase (Old Yellow Enzyme family)/thioredoxin reductase